MLIRTADGLLLHHPHSLNTQQGLSNCIRRQRRHPFRERINDWWADHLVSKANFVEAAAPSLSSDDEEEFLILKPPVEVDSKFQLPQKGPEVNY
ncbi:unnamed protein product [Closterium sp. Yama58-4]|nr:unnamed protein product [Closterium sp. Yama58-4]